ncbi:hypothetical protein [Hyunsoonleella ulvae]|uniref:hypothetical protein n=1 Tax=Hyunsoonleella ulvae TaxID=2799948 RepID=UPI001939C2CA|nr:hypothetical protein [Hyunsoonleella ulvae]
MKKYNIFFILTVLLVTVACGSDSENMNNLPRNDVRSMSVNGGSLIEIDTIQGQFIKDYEVSNTIEGSFSATNFTTGDQILLFLYDDDESSFPFINTGVFPINNNPIRATVRYDNFRESLTIKANSGSVTITEYDRIEENNRVFIKISGNLNISDDSENLTATFNNIRLQCLECE